MYTVGVTEADSLAEVCNKIRGRGKRFKVWSPMGLQLIDTNYCLVKT